MSHWDKQIFLESLGKKKYNMLFFHTFNLYLNVLLRRNFFLSKNYTSGSAVIHYAKITVILLLSFNIVV